MNFGKNLQRLRKENGMSQERLSEVLEVSRQAISKWESNATYPETEKLIALSDLFGVTIDYLIKGNELNGETNCVGGPTVHKDAKRVAPVRPYRRVRTALAIVLYAISSFWFYLLGERPGGSGWGVFLMFISIAIATGLFVYNHSIKREEIKR